MNEQINRVVGIDETLQGAMLAGLKGHQSMRIQLGWCLES